MINILTGDIGSLFNLFGVGDEEQKAEQVGSFQEGETNIVRTDQYIENPFTGM